MLDILRVAAIAVALAACGGEAARTGEVPTDGQRVTLPSVNFNKWTDFLSLQGGLTRECRFLDPLTDNDSTTWPPLQVFWVIYDQESDVKDGDRVEDTFFLGDVVEASDFPVIDGKSALGFKFLPPSQRVFLDIQEMAVLDDGAALDATLGAPLNTRLLVDAVEAGDACTTETRWCPADADPCDAQPLSSIDVELNGLNLVRDITYNE